MNPNILYLAIPAVFYTIMVIADIKTMNAEHNAYLERRQRRRLAGSDLDF